MNQLIVLDRGRITEQGTHAQLLAGNGTYAKLWRHQSGGFLGEAVPDEEGAVGAK
jgi:ABC-type multidrug transport system fused ATPase/permease subunit